MVAPVHVKGRQNSPFPSCLKPLYQSEANGNSLNSNTWLVMRTFKRLSSEKKRRIQNGRAGSSFIFPFPLTFPEKSLLAGYFLDF